MSQQLNQLGGLQLGVDRIATSPTAFSLYENVLALFRGAPTARTVMPLSPWATVSQVDVTPGTVIRYSHLSTSANNDRQELSLATSVMLLCKGTVQVTFTQSKVVLSGSPTSIRAALIRLRGTTQTVISSWEQSGTGGNSRSFDVSVLPGDSIGLVHRGRDSVPGSVAMSKLSLFRIGVASGSPHFWAIGPGSLLMSAEPQ